MSTFYPSSTFAPFALHTSESPQIILKGVHTQDLTKPPLLLIHGFPQTHVIFHKIAPSLSEHYSLIIPDLRGYGQSSKPSAPVVDGGSSDDPSLSSKKAMANDLVQLMTALAPSSENTDIPRKFYIIGHDRGARVTHSLLTHPTWGTYVHKAILLDICPTLNMYEATDSMFAMGYWHWFFLIQPYPFPENALNSAPEVFAHKMLRGLPKGAGKTSGSDEVWSKEVYEAYIDLFRDKEGCHGMCEDYRAAFKEDLEEQRMERVDEIGDKRIRCPIRVIWGKFGMIEKKFDAVGEWDRLCNKEKGGFVDKKGSVSVECGHYIPEEAPKELFESAVEFFRA